jgi:hypothetical protein
MIGNSTESQNAFHRRLAGSSQPFACALRDRPARTRDGAQATGGLQLHGLDASRRVDPIEVRDAGVLTTTSGEGVRTRSIAVRPSLASPTKVRRWAGLKRQAGAPLAAT